jgi:hypothetical protein
MSVAKLKTRSKASRQKFTTFNLRQYASLRAFSFAMLIIKHVNCRFLILVEFADPDRGDSSWQPTKLESLPAFSFFFFSAKLLKGALIHTLIYKF